MKFFHALVFLFLSISVKAQIITTVVGSYGSSILGDMAYCYPVWDNAGNMYLTQPIRNAIFKINIAGTITTIAGGRWGYSGDGGPAVNAALNDPLAIAVDNANNIYFADQDNTIIRKIDPAGIITTVSGQATTACGVGDGGPLALAKFNSILSLTFDRFNNLYISDVGCNTVRKVNSAGIITTIAGNGSMGYSGDGGPATAAQLNYPGKVAVDNAGNVYIPDQRNNRVRMVSAAGIITTFAGNGNYDNIGVGVPATNAGIELPGSVVIDYAGNFFVASQNGNVIRKIDPSGTITTFAGNGSYGYSGDGGPAILASIAPTMGRISIDNNGKDIYFANALSGYVIRKITNCLMATVSQQPVNVPLCTSGNATFSVTASNTTGYLWQVNTGAGWSNLTDNSTYSGSTSNTLLVTGATAGMNNNQYRCAAINGCGTIYSTPAVLSVNTPATPSISLAAASTTFCAGAPATFTATATNTGTAPTWQWQKNGVHVDANSNSYTDNTLTNGDVITCQLTSNATCLAITTATSNSINITITPNVVPSVTISASANNICSGTPVTFTSSVINGGSAPNYTWFKNGTNLFLNSSTYTDNSLNNGDMIMCAFSPSLACVSSKVVSGLPITMAVNPLVTPSITIAASAPAVCKNTPIVFTATSVNGGSAPIFQWKKNGVTVGTNSDNYTDNNVINGDIISCTLVSNARCITTSVAASNSIKEVMNPDPVVGLDKNENLCDGTPRILDAGAFSSYNWSTGSTDRSITINTTGTYSVIVIDKNGCTGTEYVNVTTVVPSPKDFLPADTSICSYGNALVKPISRFTKYLWSTGSVEPSIIIIKAGQYWLQAQDKNDCIGTDTIHVLPKDCLAGFFMPTAFTPNFDGKNDILKPVVLGIVKKYQFQIYNRWGQLVFISTDYTKGWDGTFKSVKQDAGSYVWVCVYQFEGETQVNKKGTFMLIR